MTLSARQIERVVAALDPRLLEDEAFASIRRTLIRASRGVVPEIERVELDEREVRADGPGDAPEVGTYLAKFAAEKITKIDNATRKQIREVLREGVSEGEGARKLSRRVQGVFSGATRKRAVRIARTEVIAASAFGREAEMRRAGIQHTMWLATIDLRVRSAHAELHGQVKRMGEPFTVDGASATRPGDFGVPELDINCRCVVVPLSRRESAMRSSEAGEEAQQQASAHLVQQSGDFQRAQRIVDRTPSLSTDIDQADAVKQKAEVVFKRALTRGFRRQMGKVLSELERVTRQGDARKLLTLRELAATTEAAGLRE